MKWACLALPNSAQSPRLTGPETPSSPFIFLKQARALTHPSLRVVAVPSPSSPAPFSAFSLPPFDSPLLYSLLFIPSPSSHSGSCPAAAWLHLLFLGRCPAYGWPSRLRTLCRGGGCRALPGGRSLLPLLFASCRALDYYYYFCILLCPAFPFPFPFPG